MTGRTRHLVRGVLWSLVAAVMLTGALLAGDAAVTIFWSLGLAVSVGVATTWFAEAARERRDD